MVRQPSLVASLVVALAACTSSHGEGITDNVTETGDPPLIDRDKVSVVVTAGTAHLVGQPGATSPGGAAVELTVVGTNENARGTSRADGSFDIQLNASEASVIQLWAKSGEERSESVYVTRGAAMSGEQLSCMQRSNLASQAVARVLEGADTSCQNATDCQQVSNKTMCTDSCGPALVSRTAAVSAEPAVSAVDQDLCATFEADGCKVILFPCNPPVPSTIACVAGQCKLQPREPAACPSCLNHTLAWGLANGQVKNRISGCDDFMRLRLAQTSCTGSVPHCGSGAAATLEEVIEALAQPDVQSALARGKSIGGPPNPGGFANVIQLDAQTFAVEKCGVGCPDGVRALLDVLARLAATPPCT